MPNAHLFTMDKKIKVCHLTSVHRWNDIRIFRKECLSLAEAGYEVHLVAPDAPDGLQQNVHVHGVETGSGGRWQRMLFLRGRVYRKALELDADIYHFHDPELLPYGLKLRKKGKKVIYDSHEDVPLDILDKKWLGPYPIRKSISLLYNAYEKRGARRLSGVVSVLDAITEKFAGTLRVSVHNYPKTDDFRSTEHAPDTPEDTRFTVVYSGGLSRIRNIHRIIPAFARLGDGYRLLLMGDWESEAYENECRGLPGWEKTDYLGSLPMEACFARVRAADLGLVLFSKIPNHLQSLPNKSFEYMAAEIPMLMSDIPFWVTEFSAYAHFADPENPDEIAAKISLIRANHAAETEKSTRESRRILEEKSWKSAEKKLLTFYGQILSTP